jgi:hypothetical protein
VDNDIPAGLLSNLRTENLPGLEVKTVGWGESNNGYISTALLTDKLKILSPVECENKIIILGGLFGTVDARFICTDADPYSLIRVVSMKDCCLIYKFLNNPLLLH